MSRRLRPAQRTLLCFLVWYAASALLTIVIFTEVVLWGRS